MAAAASDAMVEETPPPPPAGRAKSRASQRGSARKSSAVVPPPPEGVDDDALAGIPKLVDMPDTESPCTGKRPCGVQEEEESPKKFKLDSCVSQLQHIIEQATLTLGEENLALRAKISALEERERVRGEAIHKAVTSAASALVPLFKSLEPGGEHDAPQHA